MKIKNGKNNKRLREEWKREIFWKNRNFHMQEKEIKENEEKWEIKNKNHDEWLRGKKKRGGNLEEWGEGKKEWRKRNGRIKERKVRFSKIDEDVKKIKMGEKINIIS